MLPNFCQLFFAFFYIFFLFLLNYFVYLGVTGAGYPLLKPPWMDSRRLQQGIPGSCYGLSVN